MSTTKCQHCGEETSLPFCAGYDGGFYKQVPTGVRWHYGACSCGHLAQDHEKDGSCLVCSRTS